MAAFPYTPNPSNVGRFLDHIQDSAAPNKVTVSHLKSVGFTSSNDRYIVGVLKSLSFLDSTGKPTDVWKGYRDKSKANATLAQAIRSTYANLFSIYPDAYRKDEEALHNYFAANTNLAKPTLERVVRTFKILCERADFESSPAVTTQLPKPEPQAGQVPPPPIPDVPRGPSIKINVELHLPETGEAAVYENLFAAMKKHLFPNEKPE